MEPRYTIGIYSELPDSAVQYLNSYLGEGEWYYRKSTYVDTRETVYRVYAFRPVSPGVDTLLRLHCADFNHRRGPAVQ